MASILKPIQSFPRRFDWILAGAVALLLVLSLVALYSISLSKATPDFLNFKKQLIFIIVGLAVFTFFSLLDYKWLKFYSLFLYGAAIVFLVAVLFLGKEVNGMRGWFNFSWFNFQPVEFAKLALIIFLSRYFPRGAHEIYRVHHIIISGLFTLFLTGLVLLQPDLGSAMVLFFLWFGFLSIIGIRRLHLFIIVLSLVAMVLAAWFFVFADYQKARILTFVNPSSDPLGHSYNITQTQIAVGSGQFWGRGVGFGPQSQLKFIPENQTDFIFAVIAEELGFLGAAFVLGLWAIVFWRIITIAKHARDDFSLFFCLGTAILFFIQVFVNIGMTVGIAPIAGISLPFLSYGGSAMVTNLALIGVLESIAMRS